VAEYEPEDYLYLNKAAIQNQAAVRIIPLCGTPGHPKVVRCTRKQYCKQHESKHFVPVNCTQKWVKSVPQMTLTSLTPKGSQNVPERSLQSCGSPQISSLYRLQQMPRTMGPLPPKFRLSKTHITYSNCFSLIRSLGTFAKQKIGRIRVQSQRKEPGNRYSHLKWRLT